MKKVKVSRYVAGKAPEYVNPEDQDMYDADYQEYENISELHYKVAFPDRAIVNAKKEPNGELEMEESNEIDDIEEDEDDPRIRRLYKSRRSGGVEMLEDSESETEEDRIAKHIRERQSESQLDVNMEGDRSDGDEEEEENEEEIAMRRQKARENALANEKETGLTELLETINEDYVEYSDEYETDSDNEKEPKLKPVYVKPTSRLTIHKTKEELQKEKEKEKSKARRIEEEKKITKRMIEEVNRQAVDEGRTIDEACEAINSDIENENEDYEAWKLRELKRIKRDRQEKEQSRKDKEEILRIRNLSDEQRLNEFKNNPKKVTNQQIKGKLKFMQKYYHRGVYYVTEKEEAVYKRDFTAPTLEDNFNIANLPLVKQVKNFGRAGRTKYTHLVDQDTTDYEAGWASTSQTLKFYNSKAGGMKQFFDKPSTKKK